MLGKVTYFTSNNHDTTTLQSPYNSNKRVSAVETWKLSRPAGRTAKSQEVGEPGLGRGVEHRGSQWADPHGSAGEEDRGGPGHGGAGDPNCHP